MHMANTRYMGLQVGRSNKEGTKKNGISTNNFSIIAIPAMFTG
jgi:hypothetical protein